MKTLFGNYRRKSAQSRQSQWSAAVLASVVTFLITVLGFGISAFGFWVSLKQTDDLRVMIPSAIPLITIQKDRIAFMQAIDLTYINSGNRQARISDLGLVALKYDEQKPPTDRSCNEGEPEAKIYPRFDFASLVIKPGEIMDIRNLKFRPGFMGEALGDQGIQFPNVPGVTGKDTMLVCLQQRVVTPDSYVRALNKMLWLIKPDSPETKYLYEQNRPVIVRKTTTYFD
jgi:hypothetical protein